MSWLSWQKAASRTPAICHGDILAELTGQCVQPAAARRIADPDIEFNQAVKDITVCDPKAYRPVLLVTNQDMSFARGAWLRQAIHFAQVYVILLIVLYTISYLLLWSLLKKKEDDELSMCASVFSGHSAMTLSLACACVLVDSQGS
jgi:hypothetical protein